MFSPLLFLVGEEGKRPVGQLHSPILGQAFRRTLAGSGRGLWKSHVWTGQRVGSRLEVWRKWLGSRETRRRRFPFHGGAGCLPSFDRRGREGALPGRGELQDAVSCRARDLPGGVGEGKELAWLSEGMGRM